MQATDERTERAERERTERADRERTERERAERERSERLERDRADRERADRERTERWERDRADRERADRERSERLERDRADRERERAERERDRLERGGRDRSDRVERAERVERVADSLLRTATEINVMMRDSARASMQSISVMARGYEELCDCWSDLVQRTLDQSVRASYSLLRAGSVNEIMDAQNTVLRSNYETMMADLATISQRTREIAQQAAAPVTRQINDSISRVSRSRAA